MPTQMIVLKTTFRAKADEAFKNDDRVAQSTFLWAVGVLEVASVQPDATEESVLLFAHEAITAAYPRISGNWQCPKTLNILTTHLNDHRKELAL